ncbi:MAG TPA: tRNA (N6-isopentenyl adenosine(37)-C2)-methylthiotransferase MiaB [Bacilli bacterium]|nr:tRNA (N6-isopentenyl adenosine(37)-C2)-methylthiotransferase MiaB [Bacilli bacterium]
MKLPSIKEARRRDEITEYIYLKDIKDNTLYKGKKFYLRTYGCQMNVHDSEQIRNICTSLGFTETTNYLESDLIILNTCAIRENVHDKVFGFLGRLKHLKKTKKDLIIAVCGCMAQEEVVVKEILNNHPYIDIVFGTHNIHEFYNMLVNKEKDINVLSYVGSVFENRKYNRDSKYTAWVNIMYGCDKFCTYCIVPYTRGTQRSRHHEDIIKEINNLVKEGYKEVTLLGQNVNAYGKDIAGEIDFSKLLELVSATKIARIRFVTSHPWDFTDEMIEVISAKENIMPYIHLPLQAGSNDILKKMGRRYSKEEYITLYKKIKKKIPNVTISTDIIVGFPNESKKDFQDTLDVVNECKFDHAYTFVYSPREGTPAALIKDTITRKEKEDRLKELNVLITKYALASNKKLLNKTVKVLVTSLSDKDKTKVSGYTDTMKLVNFSGTKDLIGKIVDVKITTAKSFSLDGEKE